MSEEEKKVIEILKIEIDDYNRVMKNVEDVDLLDDYAEELEICETLLNLIEKQDKMIDYMAGRIVELLEEKNITNHSKKDVIEIFKNLVVNNLLKEVSEDAKN